MKKGKLLRIKEVCGIVTMKQANIYRLMRKDPPEFPQAVKLGDRSIRWWEADIDDYLSNLKPALGTGPGTGPRARANA